MGRGMVGVKQSGAAIGEGRRSAALDFLRSTFLLRYTRGTPGAAGLERAYER